MRCLNHVDDRNDLVKGIRYSQNQFYIWGAGVAGSNFYRCIKGEPIEILGFLDSNDKKKEWEGLPVYSPEVLLENPKIKVIIATLDFVEDIETYLTKKGRVYGRDFYYSHEFLELYMMYAHQKLYSHHLNVHITDKCTYHCKACSVYIPYIKNPQHIAVKKVKEGLEHYFSVVDYVMELHLLGGEPMMYPDLREIVEFIGQKYRHRIGELAIATNGTIIPDELLCESCKKHDVFFSISDYSGSPLFHKKNQIETIVQKLEQAGVSYRLGNKSQWFEFDRTAEVLDNEAVAKQRFDQCFFRNRVLKENKLYYCHHEAGAIWSKKVEEGTESSVDITKVDKNQFMAFDLGYNEQGYLPLCKRCNGYERINHCFIDAAEQLK